jgi:hypothetical protein
MGRAGCSQKNCPHKAKRRAASFGNGPNPRVLPGKPLADFFCFHFSPDTHWELWKKKNNQRPCIKDNETPAQWEEQAFHFCKALLDYFSVKGGTHIFGNKIPSHREGFFPPYRGQYAYEKGLSTSPSPFEISARGR